MLVIVVSLSLAWGHNTELGGQRLLVSVTQHNTGGNYIRRSSFSFGASDTKTTSLLQELLNKFAWLGYWFFFVLTLVEAVPFLGLLIPGGTLIYIGGILASQGYLNPWEIVAFSALGAVLGDSFGYYLGRHSSKWMGNKRIFNRKFLNRSEKFFKRYGNKSIFLGRFFGLIRGIIPFIAGLSRMNKKSFILWEIASAIIWALISVFGGYFSGTVIFYILKKWTNHSGLFVAIAIVILLSYWFIKRRHNIVKYFQKKNFWKKR